MGEKLDFVDDPILKGTLYLLAPRRFIFQGMSEPEVSVDGVTVNMIYAVESESSWLKRCTVITNVGSGE